MTLDRWDPWRELRRMEETVDRLWRGFSPVAGGLSSDVEAWGIPVDIAYEDGNVVIHASLPGVKPENITVTVEDDVLTIKASTETEAQTNEGEYVLRERRTGSFSRSIRLPDAVDADSARSSYQNGVVTVTVPRIEARKPRQLTIEVKDTGDNGEASTTT